MSAASVPRLLGAGYLAFTVDQGEDTERMLSVGQRRDEYIVRPQPAQQVGQRRRDVIPAGQPGGGIAHQPAGAGGVDGLDGLLADRR